MNSHSKCQILLYLALAASSAKTMAEEIAAPTPGKVLSTAIKKIKIANATDSAEKSNKKNSKNSETAKATASSAEKANDLTAVQAEELASKINKLVCERFFDKKAVDEIWKPAFAEARTDLISKRDIQEFAKSMNVLLKKLHTSHTQLLTQNEEAFYFMRSLFETMGKNFKPHQNDADFVGLGVGGGKAEANEVRYILDASPAAKAGFRRGDRILAVNGKEYKNISIWKNTAGKTCTVRIDRQGQKLDLRITPEIQDALIGYVTASEKSARVINHNGRKIGYIHFWSGGKGSSETLKDAVCDTLKDTDALVLDLRDGYGGAGYEDLDVFFRKPDAFPDTEMKTQKDVKTNRAYYDKPMAVLINSGVRSGKEIMAFSLKRTKRAQLFGETTAGYVVAGQYNKLSDRVILYLAVLDIKLGGERLEGKGVSPDVFIEDTLGSEDKVLDAALSHLTGK